MRFDLTNLDHQKQREFLESVKGCSWIENNYYRVLFDNYTQEFLLVKIDYKIKLKK